MGSTFAGGCAAGDRSNYVYAILLTEKRPVEDLLEAMDTGADDCLMKPAIAGSAGAAAGDGAHREGTGAAGRGADGTL